MNKSKGRTLVSVYCGKIEVSHSAEPAAWIVFKRNLPCEQWSQPSACVFICGIHLFQVFDYLGLSGHHGHHISAARASQHDRCSRFQHVWNLAERCPAR